MSKDQATTYHGQREDAIARLLRVLRKSGNFNDLNSRMILNSIEIKHEGSGRIELTMDEGLSANNKLIFLETLRATFNTEYITVNPQTVRVYFEDYDFDTNAYSGPPLPPKQGERLLLLILSKEERVNIPGDLAEEYSQISVKHGERYAKIWYYKQVVSSAWPMIRKAIRWGLLASIGEWIRRII